MKLVKFYVLLAIAVAMTGLACKDNPIPIEDTLNKVPADVSSVTSINVKKLMDKADFESIKEMEFYQDAISEANESGKAILAEILLDPEKSGVDLDQNIYLTTEMHSKNPEKMFFGAVVGITNIDNFEDLIQGDVQSENGINYIEEGGASIVAWNDEFAVLGGTNTDSEWAKEKALKFFDTERNGSIASNKGMQKAMSTKHDFSSWFSTDKLASNPELTAALAVLQIPATALKDNSIHGSLDFEDGAIVGKSEFFLNKAIGKEFLGRFFKDQTTTDFSDYIPTENLLFASSGAVDIRGIDEFLSTRPEAKSFVDQVLKEGDLTMKDIMDTFGGDVMVSAIGNDTKTPDALIVTNIKSTDKMDNFVKLALDNNALMELDKDYYKVMTVGVPGFAISQGKGFGRMLIKDDLLFLSPNEKVLEDIKNGTFNAGGKTNKKVADLLNNNTMASFFEFGALTDMLGGLDEVEFENLQMKVKGSEAEFRMETTKQNQNSLKSIFEMINAQYLDSKGREAM